MGTAAETPRATAELQRAERLRRLRGQPERHDGGSRDYWRDASPAEHARATIELSRYAERMAAQTGFFKDKDEPLPRLKPLRAPGTHA